MILGFIGTGKIAASVITGICKSNTSYKKIIEGTELNPYDFILKDQELLELLDKKSFDLVRYLVYRYKYKKFPYLKIKGRNHNGRPQKSHIN